MLSFLPSREAVKSSCLAHRWRHLWRSTPAVSVCDTDGDDLRLFVDTLLLRRHAAASSPPLRSFEIYADNLLVPHYDENRDYSDLDDDYIPKVDAHVDLWIDLLIHMLNSMLVKLSI